MAISGQDLHIRVYKKRASVDKCTRRKEELFSFRWYPDCKLLVNWWFCSRIRFTYGYACLCCWEVVQALYSPCVGRYEALFSPGSTVLSVSSPDGICPACLLCALTRPAFNMFGFGTDNSYSFITLWSLTNIFCKMQNTYILNNQLNLFTRHQSFRPDLYKASGPG